MKKNRLIHSLILTTGVLLLSSPVGAGDSQTSKYVYHGSDLAVGICKSIVNDNANKLQRILRREQIATRSLSPVDVNYNCNDKNLYIFAVNVEADKSQQYLLKLDKYRGIYKDRGRVFIDEIASK